MPVVNVKKSEWQNGGPFLGQESKNSPSFIQQSNLPFSRAFPPLFLLVL